MSEIINDNQAQDPTTAPAADVPAAPKLTRAEKNAKRVKFLFERITADTTEYNELQNEINNADKLNSLTVGSKITIKQGRKFADKDTTRIVEATIMGKADQEDGSVLYKVGFGEGFNADVAVIGAGAIVTILPVEAVAPE